MVQLPPSIWHSNVEPASFALNVERRGRVVVDGRRARVDRRVRCSQVDRPGEARRRSIRVACGICRAHVEGVAAGRERRERLRRGTGSPAAAVDAALERRAGLGRAEGEGRGGVVRRIRRRRVDRRVRRRQVDRPGERSRASHRCCRRRRSRERGTYGCPRRARPSSRGSCTVRTNRRRRGTRRSSRALTS